MMPPLTGLEVHRAGGFYRDDTPTALQADGYLATTGWIGWWWGGCVVARAILAAP